MSPGINARAESGCQELGSEANAEGGLARGQAPADGFDFGGEKGIIGGVVDADWTAHHNQQIAALGLRQGKSGGGNIDGLDGEAAADECGLEGSEVLEGKMREDDGLKEIGGHKDRVRDGRGVVVDRISVIRHDMP